jgi:cystathionine beta-lyase family protein involved in aluminum resistance
MDTFKTLADIGEIAVLCLTVAFNSQIGSEAGAVETHVCAPIHKVSTARQISTRPNITEVIVAGKPYFMYMKAVDVQRDCVQPLMKRALETRKLQILACDDILGHKFLNKLPGRLR